MTQFHTLMITLSRPYPRLWVSDMNAREARARLWLSRRGDGWSPRKVARHARVSVRTVQLELAWLRTVAGESIHRPVTQPAMTLVNVRYEADGTDGHTGTAHLRSLQPLPMFDGLCHCAICNSQVWLNKPVSTYHRSPTQKGPLRWRKAKRESSQEVQPEYGITQEELDDYLVVAASASIFAKKQEAQRDSLKTRLAAGATIEPGRYTALVVPSKRAGFTVQPKVIQSLKVIDSELLESSSESAA